LICFAHFWIDEIKISYDLKHDKKVIPFLIDQLMHLLTILLVYFFIQNIPLTLPAGGFYRIYGDIRPVIFLSFLILCTTTIDIYRFQKIREKNHAATLKLKPREIFIRVVVFTLIYVLFTALSYYARGV
ncbi:DUF3307 domain-containing protein, partial [Candidatus Peregrinibacteria bacterium]|nr:DUF3307 domain-containing protein [Candidatus Peregrinibacteria bacterium]